jgi:hypothetical protein
MDEANDEQMRAVEAFEEESERLQKEISEHFKKRRKAGRLDSQHHLEDWLYRLQKRLFEEHDYESKLQPRSEKRKYKKRRAI